MELHCFTLPTSESLANFISVKPGSIGEGWMFANLDTSWEEAVKYTQMCSTWSL